ncbi:4Fe-4S binding protein [Methanobacterium aggregans]|uniref:4Fe-4S binding protein n=1 Tax=Methanobacterium aggregans TaxID=1615586 RepID=UPI001AEA7E5D|nr:4Fe-4S binding protein [Methanobacterium aggregans]MBP2047011.1 ferredoxin [Methanobacterium aggregans]
MEFIHRKCGLCGACVVVCPSNLLELGENGIAVNGGCAECGNCSEVCPLGAIITLEGR